MMNNRVDGMKIVVEYKDGLNIRASREYSFYFDMMGGVDTDYLINDMKKHVKIGLKNDDLHVDVLLLENYKRLDHFRITVEKKWGNCGDVGFIIENRPFNGHDYSNVQPSDLFKTEAKATTYIMNTLSNLYKQEMLKYDAIADYLKSL